MPGKAGQSLRDHLDSVIRNRRLNALVRDLDLPISPADLTLDTAFDREKVHTVFDSLDTELWNRSASIDPSLPMTCSVLRVKPWPNAR